MQTQWKRTNVAARMWQHLDWTVSDSVSALQKSQMKNCLIAILMVALTCHVAFVTNSTAALKFLKRASSMMLTSAQTLKQRIPIDRTKYHCIQTWQTKIKFNAKGSSFVWNGWAHVILGQKQTVCPMKLMSIFIYDGRQETCLLLQWHCCWAPSKKNQQRRTQIREATTVKWCQMESNTKKGAHTKKTMPRMTLNAIRFSSLGPQKIN